MREGGGVTLFLVEVVLAWGQKSKNGFFYYVVLNILYMHRLVASIPRMYMN